MSKLEHVKNLLQELGIAPKRSLGQNFLISDRVINKMIDAIEKLNPSMLVEIGPGLGALTERLGGMDCPLLLIELDRTLAQFWRRRNFNVMETDALKVDWTGLRLPTGSVLVSNLPYQISTHLVVDRSLNPAGIEHMVLMFQKEVAERLTAKPRTPAYGLLTPIAQTFWRMERLVDASPKEFWPAPNVASQVLIFHRQPSPFPGWEKHFLTLLKAAFSHRRKFLLKNLGAVSKNFNVPPDGWPDIFSKLGLNAKVRAEELSPEQFRRMALHLRDMR